MRDRLKQLPTELKALLLIGGAFLFLAYGLVQRYSFVTDRTSTYIPRASIASLTLRDPALIASQLLPKMNGPLADILQSIRFNKKTSLSIFVYGIVDKTILWGLVTDAQVDEVMLPESYTSQMIASGITVVSNAPYSNDLVPGETSADFKLVSNKLEGWGSSTYRADHSTRDLPVKFFLEKDGAVRFTVGHEFLGLFPQKKSVAPEPPKFAFLPEHTALYLKDDNFPRTSKALSGYLSAEGLELDTYLAPIFAEIPGRTELLIRSRPDLATGFTLVSTPSNDFKLDYNQFDRAIMYYLGQLDPKTVEVSLADGSRSFERRSSFDDVEIKENKLSTGALYRSFTSYSGDHRLVYLIDHLGNIWLSDEPEILQNLVFASLNGAVDDDACSLDDGVGFIISPSSSKNLSAVHDELLDWVRKLSSVVFKLDDSETYLFTLCGYF